MTFDARLKVIVFYIRLFKVHINNVFSKCSSSWFGEWLNRDFGVYHQSKYKTRYVNLVFSGFVYQPEGMYLNLCYGT